MGHKGDIEARYTTNKHMLSDTVIRDMREAYTRSQAMLSPFERDGEKKNRRETLLEMWREQAKLYGIDPVKVRIEKQRVQKGADDAPSDPADLEMDAIKIYFKERFMTKPANDATKYALQQITIHLGTPDNDVKPIENLTLEHIFPKAHDKWDLKDFFQGRDINKNDIEELKTRLRNLTLLTKSLNAKLRDLPFPMKRNTTIQKPRRPWVISSPTLRSTSRQYVITMNGMSK